MTVKATRVLPALLVLLVLFGNQAAYAAGLSKTQNGHCAGSAPPEQPCPLPLWLTCCDDHAAVTVGASPIAPNSALLLPLETALVTAPSAPGARLAARVAAPPGPVSRLSTVLRI